MTAAPFCSVCRRTDRELRPYGKGGKPICLPCMTSTPEREREGRRRMTRALRRATPEGGPVGVVPGIGYVNVDEAIAAGGVPTFYIDKHGKRSPITRRKGKA